ncbi:TRAP transporter small permease [Vreelandella sp. EE27]
MLWFKKMLESVLLFLMSTMLVVMVGLMLWQVITRYLLGVPALYTEETLRFLMIWMSLIGAAYCFGTHKHLSLELVPSLVPRRVGKVMYFLNSLIVLAFAILILLWGGWKTSMSAFNQVSPIMQLSMGYVYFILPISAVLTFVLQLINLLLVMAGRIALPYTPPSMEEY